MQFVDQAQIVVEAGAGGNGCSAMTRQPFERHARPSGGNGGDGGDTYLVADPQLATLLDFQFRHHFRAGRGAHGRNNNKSGRRGLDAFIRVPVGTVIYDAQTGELLKDLTEPDSQWLAAKGGSGGFGNANASRTTPGHPGQRRELRLELKLIADVGLVGFPNAGKSSLLRRISTARPKVANYPFTTISPVLGVVAVDRPGSVESTRSFVACDIPGLIEGAHAGKGLGAQFLRHIERTRLLIHVIDLSGQDGAEPLERLHQLNRELAAHDPILGSRPQLIAANKMDLPDAQQRLESFRRQVREPVFPISCATGAGIPELIEAAWQRLQALPVEA